MEMPSIQGMETERYEEMEELAKLTPDEKIVKLTPLVAALYQEMKEAQQIESNTDRLNALATKHRHFSQMLTQLKADKEAPTTSPE